MKKLVLCFVVGLSAVLGRAQTNNLSIKEWPGSLERPLIFYISGDGGFNSFTTKLCGAIAQSGHGITALNARDYFWKKKTPQQSADEIAAYLTSQLQKRKNQQFVLVGYSFGADVLPFIVNKLPSALKNKLASTVLLAPSTSTDFVIRLWDMAGANKKRSMDVVAEINALGLAKTVIITDSSEKEFPVKDIRLKYYINDQLPGGHHFDGGTDLVAKTIIRHL